jgi:hypothetical protein
VRFILNGAPAIIASSTDAEVEAEGDGEGEVSDDTGGVGDEGLVLIIVVDVNHDTREDVAGQTP